MSATLSSSGDFTGLATDLSGYEDVDRPAHLTVNIAAADMQTPPTEIADMIRLFQDGWGALLGAGKRLDFSVTVRLLELFLQSYKNQGLPRSGDRL